MKAKLVHQNIISLSAVSPYAVGALISAGLAVLLIIVFVVLAMRLKVQSVCVHTCACNG